MGLPNTLLAKAALNNDLVESTLLKEASVLVFLFLQAFEPDCTIFGYYFATSIMEISQVTIGLSSLVGAVMIFLAPIIFKKYLGKAEYKMMFMAVQYLYLIQAAFLLFLDFLLV